jgi:protein gp37
VSKIEWCDETINPLGWGCYGPGGTPEAPRVCSYCYAKRFAARNTRGCPLCQAFIPHWHPEALNKPLHWRKPRRIFVQSMGDLFGDWVPSEWILDVLAVARDCPQHTFQFLTKNPKRLSLWNGTWPSNCWVGTTITNQPDADERLFWLNKVKASVLFVSHEPILGPIDLGPIDWATQWAIIGAQTGPGAVNPALEWVGSLIEQYKAAGVPLFLKDNLWPHGRNPRSPGTPDNCQLWPDGSRRKRKWPPT